MKKYGQIAQVELPNNTLKYIGKAKYNGEEMSLFLTSERLPLLVKEGEHRAFFITWQDVFEMALDAGYIN